MVVFLTGGTAAHAHGLSGPLHHDGRWLVDSMGRVAIVHGINQMDKEPPYAIQAQGFSAQDAAFLHAQGFNALRLGVDYAAVEPAPGKYSAAYLDKLASTVAMLGRHHIYVLLSSDDNCYSSGFGGQGMPNWMVVGDTLPSPTKNVGFPSCYLANDPAMNMAWDSFWKDDDASDGVSLQQHYDHGWALIAERTAGMDDVLGYDTLNEPWAGSSSTECEQPIGCQGFDSGPLTAYTEGVARAIHAVAPAAIVFGEPGLAFDFGVQSYLRDFGQSGPAGLSFHVYCLAEYEVTNLPGTQPPANSNCSFTDGQSFSNASSTAAHSKAALLLSEFGATDQLATIERVEKEADKHMVPWIEWTFYGKDPCCARPNEGLVRNIKLAPTASNVKAAKDAALVRPYPDAIAGTPTGWSFDASSRRFTLTYGPTLVGGGAAPARLATEIVVPALQYPHGYLTTVHGGRVTSAPNAAFAEIVTAARARKVSVTIVPGHNGSSGASGRCPPASGRLAGLALGPVRLGLRRARLRRRLPRFTTRGRRYMDFFCLVSRGIRAGYPSPKLLGTLSRSERRRVEGRVVLALTANPYYVLRGVRVGARLHAVARRLKTGSAFHVGFNYWYLAPNGQSHALLKVRHGVIQEIGITNRRLTRSRRETLTFLESFS